MAHLFFRLSYVLLPLCLAGCAATPQNIDPMESYNREMYKINKSLDRAIFKPIAYGYDRVVPYPLKTGVRNVFENINQLPLIGNDILQGEPTMAMKDTMRLVINSTLGVLGLFDVAKRAGLPKHESDFGQTLAKWGYERSAYFVIPILGPATIRDVVGRTGDFGMSLWAYLDKNNFWWTAKGIDWLSTRADFLEREKVLDMAPLDEYKFVRDGYLQRRENLIQNGSSLQGDEILQGPPE